MPSLAALVVFAVILINEIIPNQKNKTALKLIDAGEYDSAYSILEELGDASTITENMFTRATAYIEAGEYEAAYALFNELGDVETVLQNKYDRAMQCIDEENYEAAWDLLDGLDYKDSEEQKARINLKHNRVLLTKAEVGDTVLFGSFEQDNNIANGKEEIEWVVLTKEDDRILVISKYALACRQYNSTYTNTTWETSSLRDWLNTSFVSTAFIADEQAMIPDVTISDGDSPANKTVDQVFLLNINEVNQYFSTNKDRRCSPTVSARTEADLSDTDNCNWWLRSSGYNSQSAAIVASDGYVGNGGLSVVTVSVGVRPAMWIDVNNTY